jgi:hypothetical protein
MNLKKIAAMLSLFVASTYAAAQTFTVEYKPLANLSNSQQIHAELKVTNTGSQSASLSALSVQYYFTKEGTSPMTGVSDYAAVLGPNYRVITSNVAFAFDTTKINVTFGSTSGTLLSGETLQFQLRAHKNDWSYQTQSNDASFNGSITNFTPVTTITVNGGANVPISGLIKNKAGIPIAGAKVKYSGGEATTAANGTFTLNSNITTDTPITVSAPGYADFSNVYKPTSGKILIHATLLPIEVTTTINPAVANTVTTPGGAAIVFPAMSGITEQLSVSLTHIRANTRDILSAPGNFSAVTSTGSQVMLTSQGMLDVVVKGVQTGQIYSLDNKGPFTLKIPASIPSTAPATIPLWFYNTATGKWQEEGSATLANGIYQGSVTHFSTWNVDSPICTINGTCACITATVSDPSNISLANPDHEYTITAEGSGWSKTINATTAQINPINILNVPTGTARVTVTNRTTGWRGTLENTVTAGPSCTNFPIISLVQVSINGSTRNACGGVSITGATVELLNVSNQLVASTTTDSTGSYVFASVGLAPELNYSIRITHPNFVTAVVNNVQVTDDQTLTINNVLNVPNDGVTGTLTGRVLNAVDGLPLANVSYEVRAGVNNLAGPIVASGLTDANGQYTNSLPRGNYTVRAFNNVGEGVAVGVSAACPTITPNIVIGPVIPGLRIIMSWQGNPNDLDSYLRGPGYRINYQNRNAADGSASLNIDAMNGNTVEVVTITQEQANTPYTFAVHDYTNRGLNNSMALSNSGVSVTIVRNGIVTNTFNITANSGGTLWRVFTMTNGVITPVDTLAYEANTNNI